MKSPTSLSRLGLLGLLSAAVLLGCPSKVAPDAGTPEVDAGAPDAGPVDAGFKCRIDDDCAVLAQAYPDEAGFRCDNDAELEGTRADGGGPSYDCIPATACNSTGDCAFPPVDVQDFTRWYCIAGGGCRCVQEAVPDAGTSGICRRVKASCEECTTDAECGSDPALDTRGVCKALQGDASGTKYCFKVQNGPTCGCGMVNDGTGACVPQSGSCSSVGCSKDADCPGGSVCNVSACLCEQRCRWNFDPNVRDTVPSCGPSKSCWVDADAIDATSPYFGAGRCKGECQSDSDCSYGGSFPDGRQKLKCAGEAGKNGPSLKRCRPNGECMDTQECPDQPSESLNLGYCDRASFSCQDDCRLGVDPMTGQSFNDCKPGNKCEQKSNGTRTCERQSCVELGGARIACPASHLCNNEDRNGDGAQDPAPAGSTPDAIGCYRAPNPPYCYACEKNEDCQLPAFASQSPLPNLCIQAGPDSAGEPKSICGIATFNDPRFDDGGIPRDQRMCPANWFATAIPVDLVDGPSRCNTDADCSVGNDGGICALDTTLRITDDQGNARPCTNDSDCTGGNYGCNNPSQMLDGGTCIGRTCMCNAPNGTECPQNPDAGITTYCRYKVGGQSQCILSVVCLPGQSFIARPTDQGGCGF